MEIRHKITLQFSILVAFLLLGILSFNYFLALNFARESFYDRLRQRAVTVAELESDLIQRQKSRGLNLGSLSLPDELIEGFDTSGKRLFSVGSSKWTPDESVLKELNKGSEVEKLIGNRFTLSFRLNGENGLSRIIASARDDVGTSKLHNMARTMLLSILIFLVFVVLTGQYLSRKALEPIQSVIRQVQQITARNLDRRVQHENNRDEIAQLSQTFNSMLERLESSFKSQSDFVRNSSHELRNPLAAMIGQAEIALKKDRDPDYYKGVIQAVFQEGLRLKHIVNSLLHLSKASPETVQKTHEHIRLDELLLDVVENLIRSDTRRKISVKLEDIREAGPVVLGNRSLLEVAIGNLIENACKFSGFQTVECGLSGTISGLELLISDKGVGMSQEEIDRISEPFFRSAKVRDKEGFGIGMAVASRVFQVHEVQMRIDSDPGTGTRIALLFPVPDSPRMLDSEGWTGQS